MIDVAGVVFLIARRLIQHYIQPLVASQSGQDVQPAAAAIALQFVGAIRDRLQLFDDELRDDDPLFEEAVAGDVGNAAVDQDARIQQDWPRALGLLGEFDVRNDEAKIILRLQHEADREVAADDPDGHLGKIRKRAELLG